MRWSILLALLLSHVLTKTPEGRATGKGSAPLLAFVSEAYRACHQFLDTVPWAEGLFDWELDGSFGCQKAV